MTLGSTNLIDNNVIYFNNFVSKMIVLKILEYQFHIHMNIIFLVIFFITLTIISYTLRE